MRGFRLSNRNQLTLCFLRFIIQVLADCGLPAIPPNTVVKDLSPKYKEGFICEYECEFEELSLIGGKFRICINGKWVGNIPKCVQNWSPESITRLEVSDLSGQNLKNYSYKQNIDSCIKSDVNVYSAASQKWFVRFNKMIRHIIYFEMDFLDNENNSLNIIRAHTNHIRGCTHEKLDTSYNSSLIRYGFRCDIKFEGQEAYSAWDKDQTSGLTIEFDETIVTLCKLSLYHETYARYHWCGTNEQPLNSVSEYFTGSELYKEIIFFRYSCVDGFELIGNRDVRCSASNYWLDTFPICVPNQTYCELHPTDSINTDRGYQVNYENLYLFNDTSYAIKGSLAIYSCVNENHVLIGDSMRMCDQNGKWIGFEPFCSDMSKIEKTIFDEIRKSSTNSNVYENLDTNLNNSCGIPSIPSHSRLVDPKLLNYLTKATNLKPVYSNGSEVAYYCESTYKWIYGEYSKRQCVNGQWIGKATKCFINYEEKMLLTKIEISKNVDVNGTLTAIVENETFSIKQKEQTGEWDHLYSYYRDVTQGECRPTIQIDVKQRWTFYFNDSRVITHFVIGLNPRGLLDGPLNNSKIIIAKVGENMCQVGNFENVGSTTKIAFDCNESFDVKVNEISIYFDGQDWRAHKNVSVCTLNVLYNSKTCGKPDHPMNSIVKIDSKSGAALYSCVPGYELKGSGIIHCGPNGEWMETPPKCIAKELCSMALGNSTGLIVKYLNTYRSDEKMIAKHRTLALYSCENSQNRTDMMLVGSRIRMCLLNGKWSGSEPICQSFVEINDENSIKDQESTFPSLILFAIFIVLLTGIAIVVIVLKRRYNLSISPLVYFRFR